MRRKKYELAPVRAARAAKRVRGVWTHRELVELSPYGPRVPGLPILADPPSRRDPSRISAALPPGPMRPHIAGMGETRVDLLRLLEDLREGCLESATPADR